MNLWRKLRRKCSPGEEPDVQSELQRAYAVRRRAREDLAKAEALEEHAHEVAERSAELANRNGFADLILETFDLRK